MKRIVSLIISAVMVSAALAGCGAQESSWYPKSLSRSFPKLIQKEMPFPAIFSLITM